MSGTKDGVAAAAAGDGVALVVIVCANNGVPIAAAISGSKIFMPKVF
jgi:FAD/FMN-containing dehydrogenase